MASITIEKVDRKFGTIHAAREISLEIKDGEFFTLLGPSGCGKTTLMRMIAGFCELDSGSIRFGDRRIDTLPPHRRNTGMVFQNYAIFPNLTVAGNVAYGLRVRGVNTSERNDRVRKALKLVHLDGYEDRWPYQLSGGQLQRVAIARCLVIEPEVLLLDEPLSNLDAKLRVEMRHEIRQLQQKLKLTAIYVTHDQEEALAISQRIGVMRAGQLEQVGTPWEIYNRPSTAFVADFMGVTNLLPVVVTAVRDGRTEVKVGKTLLSAAQQAWVRVGDNVTFLLRPEALKLLSSMPSPGDGMVGFEATIARVEYLGVLTRVDLDLDGLTLRLAVLDKMPASVSLNQRVVLGYDPDRAALFPAK
ncbi:MAG: ABC transporter ATP-binding protein [Alphaproteobacteria bacterium]|nr:ABC transporter ATP-binding protein [Alphaproteobacteria bacterium]